MYCNDDIPVQIDKDNIPFFTLQRMISSGLLDSTQLDDDDQQDDYLHGHQDDLQDQDCHQDHH